MTPERYQQIDHIFQVALGLDPAKRAAYLDEACSGDEALRSQVESLITSDEGGLSFIDEPAFEMAARVLASDEPALSAGDHIDRYTVLSLLGSGGMGEVYLAHDEKLDRKIALKLLPTYFTRNQERLRRFQLEARAASTLNHPNIITIHEIGQIDNRHFIGTEFIDGETLRRHMKSGPLSLNESLDIASQVCSALAAAHQAGIFHRDIKPENIMLRTDGYVKVLDFGLAKVAQQDESPTAAGPVEKVNVSSGLLMGTVKYMSPEQAEGLPVDQRSDIFSLGVVLYEMLTGHAPFEGKTASDLISAILSKDPVPLKDYSAEATDRLQQLIDKALCKEKEVRYQTAQELLYDLRSLSEQYSSTGITRLIVQAKQHKMRAGLALAALVVVLGTVSSGLFRYRNRHVPFQSITVTKLTNFGDAWEPSISPDGKYVVYEKKGSGTAGPAKFSLWIRATGTTNELQLVPVTEGYLSSPRFSPDGRYVYYNAQVPSQAPATFRVSTSGGDVTKLPLITTADVSLSPDGKRLAYLENRLPEGKTVLVVANADGTAARDIITRQAPNYYWNAQAPQWSPDGRLIACVGQNGDESFPHIFVVNVETGGERAITRQHWNSSFGFVWLPDMSLLFVAAEETSSNLQIWRISYPDGEAQRITNDTLNYYGLSVSADGTTLVSSILENPTSIWVVPVGEKNGVPFADTDQAKEVNAINLTASNNWSGYATLAWTPEERIVFVSEESGNADIWSMNADGTVRRQLTTDRHWDTAPSVSPDGRYIVFMSNRAGKENIWRMDIDGENQKQLTNNLIERNPVFSADSKWVYFTSWQTGIGTIWRIPVEGGEPTQVISDLSFYPTISPDGRLLAYSASGKTCVVPVDGGQPIKTIEGGSQWTPDGQALTGLMTAWDNVLNVWAQPLDGREPKQLTNFKSNGVLNYAWSRDGKQLAVTRGGTSYSNVVLISDLR
jgi:Tol biopolymer transport system component